MGINSKITKYPESRRELSFFHKLQTKACESLFNILDTMKEGSKSLRSLSRFGSGHETVDP